MSEATWNTILIATDLSELGETSLDRGIAFAETMRAGRVHLVHVVPTPPPEMGSALAIARETMIEEAGRRINAVEIRASQARVTREVRSGGVAKELALTAMHERADVIVVARHERGAIGRALLGSVASALVRAAPCPVLVVGRDRRGPLPLTNIVAAVDLSPISKRVLETAAGVGSASRGTVRALSVAQIPSLLLDKGLLARIGSAPDVSAFSTRHREVLGKLISTLRDRAPDLGFEVWQHATPSKAILEFAASRAADLIVMGSSGYSAWERILLGSTASAVLAHAPCAVMVVPP